jgi:hypothetical protein
MKKFTRILKKIKRVHIVLIILISIFFSISTLNTTYFQGFTKLNKKSSQSVKLNSKLQKLTKELKYIQKTNPKNFKDLTEIKKQIKKFELKIQQQEKNERTVQRFSLPNDINLCEFDIDNDGLDNSIDNCPFTHHPHPNSICNEMVIDLRNTDNDVNLNIQATCDNDEESDCELQITFHDNFNNCPSNGVRLEGLAECSYVIPRGSSLTIEKQYQTNFQPYIYIGGNISELSFEDSDIEHVKRLGDLGLKRLQNTFNNIDTLKSITGEANLTDTNIGQFLSHSSIKSLDASYWQISPQTSFALSFQLTSNLEYINFSNLNFTGVTVNNLRSGHLRNIKNIFLVNITSPENLFNALNDGPRPEANIILGSTDYNDIILDNNGDRRYFQNDTLYCNTIDQDGNSINQGLDCLPMTFTDENNNGYEDHLEACGRIQSPLRVSTNECNFDTDQDSIDDSIDNCPFTFNPQQTDSDENGMGDACEDMLFDLDGSTDQNPSPNAFFYTTLICNKPNCNIGINFQDNTQDCPDQGVYNNGYCNYQLSNTSKDITKEYDQPIINNISIKGTIDRLHLNNSDVKTLQRLGNLNLTDAAYLLYFNHELQTTEFKGEFETSNVNSIRNLVSNTNIRDLNLYHWDVSNIINFQNAFIENSQLSRVNFSTWNIKNNANVTNILNNSSVENLFLQNVNFNRNLNNIRNLLNARSIQNIYLGKTDLSIIIDHIRNSNHLRNASFFCNTRNENNTPINMGINCQPMPFNDLNFNGIDDDQEAVCLDPNDLDTDQDGTRDTDDNCPEIANPDQSDIDQDGQGDICDDDIDGDNIENEQDNCPEIPNVDQTDLDEDNIGDQCDNDMDGDSIENEQDNCPAISNPDQANSDTDRQGDACDNDADNDGIENQEDNCPFIENSNQRNGDGDNFGDACDNDFDNDGRTNDRDNCPAISNPDQANSDTDRQGDACDNDADNDGIENQEDNCPFIENSNQRNGDGDNFGDACDNDIDNDGLDNRQDNCPSFSNVNQEDQDNDGIGDVCDPDRDGDGYNNTQDNCPEIPNADQADLDEDQIGDICDDDIDGDEVLNEDDNCLQTPNPSQSDRDRNGQGDACDEDMDGDGFLNNIDNCPYRANRTQRDRDGDGQGDLCDADIDGDGLTNGPYRDEENGRDNCPFNANPNQEDMDNDGIGNVCDIDMDNDGIVNIPARDNCPSVSNIDQEDQDEDGIGDICDNDLDGDNIPNSNDNCPTVAGTQQGCPSPEVVHIRTDRPTQINVLFQEIIKPRDSSLDARNQHYRSRNMFLSPQQHQLLFYSNQNPSQISCYFGMFFDENDIARYNNRTIPNDPGWFLSSFDNEYSVTTAFRYRPNTPYDPPSPWLINCPIQYDILNEGVYWAYNTGIQISASNYNNNGLQLKLKRNNNDELLIAGDSSQVAVAFSFENGDLKLTDQCHNAESPEITNGDYFMINSIESTTQTTNQQNNASQAELRDHFNTELYNPNYAFKITRNDPEEEYINIELVEVQNTITCQ